MCSAFTLRECKKQGIKEDGFVRSCIHSASPYLWAFRIPHSDAYLAGRFQTAAAVEQQSRVQMTHGSKEQFLRECLPYGYGATNGEAMHQREIDRMRAQEFTHMQGSVYLDHAGATMYSSAQLQSVFAELNSGVFSNPHSHLHSGEEASASAKVERVRHQAMRFFSASEEEYELIFTSGATAALKLVGECFPWQEGSQFVYAMDSHTSVLGIRGYATKYGASTRCIPLDEMKDLEGENPQASVTEANPEDTDSPMSLFAFPAECNFSGVRHSLKLVDRIQNSAIDNERRQKWLVLLDAAKYVSTHRLDLSIHKPDFVVLSFYKMFGYPTGLGALFVKKSALRALRKDYYGGGTVQSILASQNLVIPRGMPANDKLQRASSDIAARFADGTQSFLSILSLRHGFDQLERLGMTKIEAHTTALTRLLYSNLTALKHWSNFPVCEIYGNHNDLKSGAANMQGSIVACNFFRHDGGYVGYSEVSKLAAIHNIQLRTGCFCNPGACQSYLRLKDKDLIAGIEAGHICGDDMDLLNGLPTGAVRLSIGYMTSYEDIMAFIDFVTKYFVSTKEPVRVAASEVRFTQPAKSKQVHLCKITLFPIKSCSGMTVNTWPVGSRGLLFDREWAIVDAATNKALSLKELPELCFVLPEVDLKQQTLTITFQNLSVVGSLQSSFVLPLTHTDTRSSRMGNKDAVDTARDMSVCAGACKGRDVGADVSQWLSARLNRQCALMRVAPTHLRDSEASRPKRSGKSSSPTSDASSSDEDKTGTTSPSLPSSKIGFANQAQYLLISRASIANLNAALRSADDTLEVDEDAFRANLIVDGCEAFEEDSWTRLHIGGGSSSSSCDSDEGVTFDVSGPCSRCNMINVDPKTGAFNRAPLQTLSKYRRERSSIFFGQFLTRRSSAVHESVEFASSMQWLRVDDAVALSP